MAVSSLVSGDCIISGASLKRSLIFTGARINSYSTLDHVVMLPDCTVGRNARLTNVVIDHGVNIPEGMVVGEDPVLDAKRFRVSEEGIGRTPQPLIDRLGVCWWTGRARSPPSGLPALSPSRGEIRLP